MRELVCYKTLSEWNTNSIPKTFRQCHNTKVGTWAKLTIFEGQLQYDALDENSNVTNTYIFSQDNQPPFIEPQAWHKVTPLTNDLRCQLAFYCQPRDYYEKKYHLSAVHSEVIEVMQYIQTGDAFDLGCGNGRNALFLQQRGFQVTGVDINPNSIEKLNQIIVNEKLNNISVQVADCNLANIIGNYDLIIATVVLMFLDKKRQPDVITNMQQQTRPNGYNVIVCALDCKDYPCGDNLPFQAPMKAGELKQYYKGWNIKKYNEDVGHLHRKDANGNRIALRFATLIAQKPA